MAKVTWFLLVPVSLAIWFGAFLILRYLTEVIAELFA